MSLRRVGVVFLLGLLVIGAAVLVTEGDKDDRSTVSSDSSYEPSIDAPGNEIPTGVTGRIIPGSSDAGTEIGADEPFEWSEAEIIDHLGLERDGSGYLFRSDSSSSACRVDALLTSAEAVSLHDASGYRMFTNASQSAGVAWSREPRDGAEGPIADASGADPIPCAERAGELAHRVETLRPGVRTPAEEAADLAALDDELLDAAKVLAEQKSLTDPEWPGLDGEVGDKTVTLTGSSLGRCRQVVVNADWTISAPSSC